MNLDTTLLMQEMTDNQRLMFLNELNNKQKKKSTCYLWLIFFGGIGAHHYYMGNVVAGIFYTLFCWTFIPAICAFIELFLASSYVDNYNGKFATQTAQQIKVLS